MNDKDSVFESIFGLIIFFTGVIFVFLFISSFFAETYNRFICLNKERKTVELTIKHANYHEKNGFEKYCSYCSRTVFTEG
jgi:hypothetical protein